ncbi:MAG: hypothetical protein M3Q57_10640 [Pseudomonadota bacterium]|nr:hypothetical protein [Pseudomonadota bacterium]
MRRWIIALLTIGAGVGAVAFAGAHEVSLAISPADAAIVDRLALPPVRPTPARGVREEIAVILAVQDHILSAAPINRGIPEGRPRELPDLIRIGYGLCFDRSRAIETVLRARGFETRHAAIYSTAETGSALESFATPRTESHAVTEVKTAAGWLLVDSNQRWIGLTADGRPIDLIELRQSNNLQWHPMVKDALPYIYTRPFTWAYGLYSRHGRFYPPYNAVPDVNWSELMHNL